jgi:hypothetical protein
MAARRWMTAAAATLLLLWEQCGPAGADSDKEGNVITYVCRVDTTFTDKSGESYTSTSCIDGKSRCNETAGRGYCSPVRPGVTRSCDWVSLSMCRSQ